MFEDKHLQEIVTTDVLKDSFLYIVLNDTLNNFFLFLSDKIVYNTLTF